MLCCRFLVSMPELEPDVMLLPEVLSIRPLPRVLILVECIISYVNLILNIQKIRMVSS